MWAYHVMWCLLQVDSGLKMRSLCVLISQEQQIEYECECYSIPMLMSSNPSYTSKLNLSLNLSFYIQDIKAFISKQK